MESNEEVAQLRMVADWLSRHSSHDSWESNQQDWNSDHVVGLLRLMSWAEWRNREEPEYPWMTAPADNHADDHFLDELGVEVLYEREQLQAIETALRNLLAECQLAVQYMKSYPLEPPTITDGPLEPF